MDEFWRYSFKKKKKKIILIIFFLNCEKKLKNCYPKELTKKRNELLNYWSEIILATKWNQTYHHLSIHQWKSSIFFDILFTSQSIKLIFEKGFLSSWNLLDRRIPNGFGFGSNPNCYDEPLPLLIREEL